MTTKRFRGPRRSLAMLVVALAVAGCPSILPGINRPPPRLYTLTPKSTFAPELPKVDWQLVIEVPIAAEGINNTRVAVMADPTSLDYYADARWTERAPLMVQTLMVESFENTGRIIAVGRQSVNLRADYVLRTDLREFQAELDPAGGAPRVRIRLTAKLVKMPRRAILDFVNVEHVAPAKDDSMAAIIAAFDTALGKVLKRTVEWTLRAAK